jgi:predicted dehydrogenase
MPARIGVGLVGFGMAGRVFHAPLLESLPDFELRAIVDQQPADPARSYPEVPVVHSLDAVLDDDQIELVIVATPNATHSALAVRALRADRHVVIEKPMAPTSRDADRLIGLAAAQRRILTVFHSRRWDDDYLTVREVIAAGHLGRVERYIARFEFFARPVADDWRRRPGPGSGLLCDVGSHLIDQALDLFGRPRSVSARLHAIDSRPVDAFVVLLDIAGVEVLLLGSERTALPGPTFEVHGTSGSLVVDGGRDGQEGRLSVGRTRPGRGERPALARLARTGPGPVNVRRVRRERGDYGQFYVALAQAIRTGAAPPVTAAAARDVIRVIEACERSDRIGRAIRVTED